ncbi:MAG: hypothetical protein ACFCBW_22490, partial [Candidatus Competibacterales bacterium]
AALAAATQGTPWETLAERLRALPLRSPYRDLRWLLTAFLKGSDDPAAGRQALDKLPQHSPYAPWGAALRVALLPPKEALAALSSLKPAQRELALAWSGWSAGQQKLVVDWLKLAPDPPVRARLDFLVRQRDALDPQAARRAAEALVVESPTEMGRFTRGFGKLDEAQRLALKARGLEAQDYLPDAIDTWRACIRELRQRMFGGKNPEGKNKHPELAPTAALLLRHTGELWLQAPPRARNNSALLAAWEQSIGLDPDHWPTYLNLVKLYRETGDRRSADQWLNKAVDRFGQPGEALVVPVVVAAAEAAMARGAFKKAVNYAQRIKHRDPINDAAQHIIHEAHLGHARKQLRNQRFDLAAKELASAAPLRRRVDGQIPLLRALSHLMQGEKAQAKAAMTQAGATVSSPVLLRLRAVVDADRLAIPQDQVDAILQVPKGEIPDPDALMDLVGAMGRYQAQAPLSLKVGLRSLKAPLKRAICQPMDHDQAVAVCEALCQQEAYDLMEETAKAALKREGDTPALVFYQLYGRCQGQPLLLREGDMARVDAMAHLAQQRQDHRAMALLARLFEPVMELMADPDDPFDLSGPFADPPPFQAGPESPFELPDQMPPELAAALARGLEKTSQDPEDFLAEMTLLILEMIQEGHPFAHIAAAIDEVVDEPRPGFRTPPSRSRAARQKKKRSKRP